MVTAITNPVLVRGMIVLCCAGFAFVMGVISMRLLRKNISEEADLTPESGKSPQTLPFHLYSTVIQQLKQQKHELQVQTQAEQRRARMSENFSQAVLSNLSSGVLVFGTNGLVKQANSAAKEILGLASPVGMGADEIFRNANASSKPLKDGIETHAGSLAAEVHCVLREGSSRRQTEADHTTPGGITRRIAMTVSPVPANDGTLAGVACLINDRSEVEQIRREQLLRQEISSEMALRLRNSLVTISGYAQQLASSGDPEFAKQLAAYIAEETSHLDRSIGGFLAEESKAKATANASV